MACRRIKIFYLNKASSASCTNVMGVCAWTGAGQANGDCALPGSLRRGSARALMV
jgi:hypothetical protein